MRFRSKKLLQSAKNQECVHCGKNDGTVVAAHLAPPGQCWGGHKVHDWLTAHLCSDCHFECDSGKWRRNYESRNIFICRTLWRNMEHQALVPFYEGQQYWQYKAIFALIGTGVLAVQNDLVFWKAVEELFQAEEIQVSKR